MSWISDFFKRNKTANAVAEHLVDQEIDVIFAHNTPDQVEAAAIKFLTQTPIGKTVLGQMGMIALVAALDPILKQRSTEQAKADFKVWVHGRLGLNGR